MEGICSKYILYLLAKELMQSCIMKRKKKIEKILEFQGLKNISFPAYLISFDLDIEVK